MPRALAKRYRPSKWRVGISPQDHNAMGGALFQASIDYQLEAAKQRRNQAEREMALTDRLQQCPKCGSGAYRERKAASSA